MKIVVIKKVNCAPCAVLTKLIPSLREAYPDLEWEIMELENSDTIPEMYEMNSFPTTFIVKDGNILGKQAGALGVKSFIARIIGEQ